MQAIRHLWARVRALPQGRADALLAAILLAEASTELVLLPDVPPAERIELVAVFAVAAVFVALRRRAPLLAVGATLCAIIAGEQIAGPTLSENAAGPFFWILLACYTLGRHTSGARLAVGVVLGTALMSVNTALDSYSDDVPSYINSTALAILAPIIFGQVLRNRTRLNEALRSKAERLESDRRDASEAAALHERTRIAGELHDVVAHALSAMTVQASAARRMAERDPERAADAFAMIEGTGREALTELRRLLGVLRREDEEFGLAPQPSLAHIGTLARRALAGGLPVELTIEGEQRPLPAGVDLTAYRLVQEALTRARDTGGGRAWVTLRYTPAGVELEIVDDGEPSGRRLLGMRERVAVYGGEVKASPPPGGGWRVEARLPVEAIA